MRNTRRAALRRPHGESHCWTAKPSVRILADTGVSARWTLASRGIPLPVFARAAMVGLGDSAHRCLLETQLEHWGLLNGCERTIIRRHNHGALGDSAPDCPCRHPTVHSSIPPLHVPPGHDSGRGALPRRSPSLRKRHKWRQGLRRLDVLWASSRNHLPSQAPGSPQIPRRPAQHDAFRGTTY